MRTMTVINCKAFALKSAWWMPNSKRRWELMDWIWVSRACYRHGKMIVVFRERLLFGSRAEIGT